MNRQLLGTIPLLGLLWLILPCLAEADTEFTYTGLPYNFCAGTYAPGGINDVCSQPYALSLTFDTTLSGSQLDNLTLTSTVCRSGPCIGTPLTSPTGGDLTSYVTSFSFADGSGFLLTQANATQYNFDITTDSSGNIQSWAIYAVVVPPDGTGTYYQAITESGFSLGTSAGYVESLDNTEALAESSGVITGEIALGACDSNGSPYVMSSPSQWTITSTPEPSSLLLLVTGVVGLGLTRVRRRYRQS